MTPRRSLVCLVALVVAASIAATAHGLYAVALASGVPWQVAVLYPIITDGLALVAYWATKQLESARYPWLVIVVAAGLSGLAQAVNLAGLGESPTWLRFGVGYWPAVAVLFAAHLLWLVGRPRQGGAEEEVGDGEELGRDERQGAAGQVGGGRTREAEVRGVGVGAGADARRDQAGRGEAVGEVREEVTSAGGSGGRTPAPGSSAPDSKDSDGDSDDLDGEFEALIEAIKNNGHGATKTEKAIAIVGAYETVGRTRPSISQLAGLAGCSTGTAQIALTRMKEK